MRILVTGATGFIGTHVVRSLSNAGHSVLGTSRSSGALPAPDDFDLCPYRMGEPLPRVVRDWLPEAAIHLAWEGIPDFSSEACLRNLDHQTKFFRFLLELPSVRRIVTAGSCREYGAAIGRSSGSLHVSPDSDFGRAKVSLHKMLRSSSAEAGVELVWLRLFYVYGPGQRSESLIPSILARLQSEDSPVVRHPEAMKDFVYVADVADAFERAARFSNVDEVIDIGSGRLRRLADVLSTAISGVEPVQLEEPDYQFPEPEGLWANLEAGMRSLDWRPRTSLVEGILSMRSSLGAPRT